MCPLVLTDKQRGLQTVFQFVYQFEMGSSLQNFIGERYASIFIISEQKEFIPHEEETIKTAIFISFSISPNSGLS